jgi:glycosyltransferase involved in cell wall biosynthesis
VTDKPRAATVLLAHPSAELYGSDRVLLETVQGLCEHGARVVVTVPSAGPLVAEIRARGGVVELCPTPVLRKDVLRPAGALRCLLEAVRGLPAGVALLRRTRPDVVFVNTLTIPLWVVLGRLSLRSVVCHVHEAERSVPALIRRLLAAPVLLAHHVVLNSRFSLDVLAGSFPSLRRRATVVYNGIPGPWQPVAAREHVTGTARLLYVGRLSPRKGPAVALDALSILVDRGVDARLDLVGSVFSGYEWFGAELAEKVAADPRLRERVSFHGFVADIWPHVASSDIVIVPSMLDEPFGNTAVEAVLAARPAVVSATSGLLEAAAGYQSVRTVEPAQPGALADAVCVILGDWETYRDAAVADSARARELHAPQAFRDEMAQLVGAVGAKGALPRVQWALPRVHRHARAPQQVAPDGE